MLRRGTFHRALEKHRVNAASATQGFTYVVTVHREHDNTEVRHVVFQDARHHRTVRPPASPDPTELSPVSDSEPFLERPAHPHFAQISIAS